MKTFHLLSLRVVPHLISSHLHPVILTSLISSLERLSPLYTTILHTAPMLRNNRKNLVEEHYLVTCESLESHSRAN